MCVETDYSCAFSGPYRSVPIFGSLRMGTECTPAAATAPAVFFHLSSVSPAPLAPQKQVQQGRRSRMGGKVQINSRGVASLAVQLRSDQPQWWGLAGLIPLINLGWGAVRSALARHNGDAGGGLEEAGEAGWEEQQQQYMPELAQLLQQHQAAALHQQLH